MTRSPGFTQPPATVPANDWMLEVSRANTFTALALTTKLVLSSCANTVEVRALVVLEPAAAADEPPAMPAATDRMVPLVSAVTDTAPPVRTAASRNSRSTATARRARLPFIR